VEESVKADQIIPVLVLSERELDGGPEELGKTLQYFVDHDDVCSDEFTGILVVKPSNSRRDRTNTSAIELGSTFSSVYHLMEDLSANRNGVELASGPYFLSGPNLHQAWRLYPDELDAFTVGMIPENIQSTARYVQKRGFECSADGQALVSARWDSSLLTASRRPFRCPVVTTTNLQKGSRLLAHGYL
jgi:hypothetical protein